MSIKKALRMCMLGLMFLPLGLGPMPPEEIEKLLHATNQQTIAFVLEESEDKEPVQKTLIPE